jgi:hypothetical protein
VTEDPDIPECRGLRIPQENPLNLCTLDGCQKKARSKGSKLCAMHYHRQYRHGDASKVATREASVSNGRRYRTMTSHGHPLAKAHGKVYVHRAVLYDTIGPGSHSCHWCGTSIEWFKEKSDPALIHVDHLNNIGDDNRPENLVPSCRTCNGLRGLQRRAEALRRAGWWSVNDTIAALRDPSMRRRPLVQEQAA